MKELGIEKYKKLHIETSSPDSIKNGSYGSMDDEEEVKQAWLGQNMIIKNGKNHLIQSAIKEDEFVEFRKKLFAPSAFSIEPTKSSQNMNPESKEEESSSDDENEISEEEAKELRYKKKIGDHSHMDNFKKFLVKCFERYPKGSQDLKMAYEEYLEDQKKENLLKSKENEIRGEIQPVKQNNTGRTVSTFWGDPLKPLPIVLKRNKIYNEKFKAQTPFVQNYNKEKGSNDDDSSKIKQLPLMTPCISIKPFDIEVNDHLSKSGIVPSFPQEGENLGSKEKTNIDDKESIPNIKNKEIEKKSKNEYMIQAPYKKSIFARQQTNEFYIEENQKNSDDD